MLARQTADTGGIGKNPGQ